MFLTLGLLRRKTPLGWQLTLILVIIGIMRPFEILRHIHTYLILRRIPTFQT